MASLFVPFLTLPFKVHNWYDIIVNTSIDGPWDHGAALRASDCIFKQKRSSAVKFKQESKLQLE